MSNFLSLWQKRRKHIDPYSKTEIPVLIAPAYNRHDLLLRMLRSIDVPVTKGLVLDNGMNINPATDGVLLAEMMRLNLSLFTPPFSSIGYGGGINFSILQTSDAPWWMWVSNDVEFEPGHLATVIERMNQTEGPRIVTGGFTWAAVNRALIEVVGLVDEHSFFPIYYDDNDYHHRCKLAEVEWVEDWANGSKHGDGGSPASLTIASDQKAKDANNRSFMLNQAEYRQKWGGDPGSEVHESPWNTGFPVWVTRPSVNGRRDRQW